VSEDVTAATFERALRSLDTFEWRGSGFAGWLHRIAAHELADHYRRQGRAQTARGQRALRELAGGGVVGADDAVPDERVDVILAALGRINPRYQQAVSLRYLAGLSHEEAAEAMGCSKPVMAVTLHRALAALRREMGVAGADDADARDRGDERDRVDEGDR
jgi:RNA polymerase sigma-70 factor (ECF subfamily)